MNIELLAAIIQGEAAVLGPIGMYAVAGCLATQLDADWLPDEIESVWYGRAEPDEYAVWLAQAIESELIPTNGYLYCLSLNDISDLGFPPGELVVSLTGKPYQLHLFRSWPGDT